MSKFAAVRLGVGLVISFVTVGFPSISLSAELEAGRHAIRTKNFSLAYKILSAEAAAGNVDAQYYLSGLYRHGLGTQVNRDKSKEWLSGAAGAGHVYANSVVASPWDSSYKLVQTDDLGAVLVEVAQAGDVALALTLIEQGANTDVAPISGRTALIEATEHGHLDLVAALIDKGARVDAQDENGQTPLFKAVRKGHQDVTRLLLRSGADVNHVDSFGNAPIHIAVATRDVDHVKLLIEQGADANLADSKGRSPLELAHLKDSRGIAGFIVAQPGVEPVKRQVKSASVLASHQSDRRGRQALDIALSRGDLRNVKRLVGAGADLRTVDGEGMTPLMKAASRGHAQVVQWLLSQSIDPRTQREDGFSALHFAVQGNHLPVVNLLVEVPGLASLKTRRGESALLIGVRHNAVKVVDRLLASRLYDSLEGTRTGVTPLMVATKHGHMDLVSRLIESGADRGQVDESGHTALWYSVDSGHTELLTILNHKQAMDQVDREGNGILHQAALRGNEDVVSALLRMGVAQVDSTNHQGNTPLMVAANHGHLKVVSRLVSAGADLDHKNAAGNTALVMSVARGNADQVAELMALGANPKSVNKERQNAFDVAKRNGVESVLFALQGD
ncbi:MAG: ankyrin repeat domain-containing protein [Pseudomonadota bacterium]